MQKNKIEGIIPAVITPFNKDGKIDEKSLETEVKYLSNTGVNGFFVCGTTGEGVFLTTEEKVRVFRVVYEIAKNRQFVGIASLRPSTNLVMDEIASFYREDISADFVGVVAPFYCRVSQKDIFEHFRIVARNSPYPVFMYNIPQCTNNPIELDTIREVSQLENIIGIKDSSGNFVGFLKGIRTIRRENFYWIQGDDRLYAHSFISGASGVVSGLANILADPYVEMYRNHLKKDYASVIEKQREIDGLFEIIEVAGGKVIPSIKEAVSLTGRTKPYMKNSYMELSAEEKELVKKKLISLGVIN